MTADLLDKLPGADIVRRGLEDTRSGRLSVESCLVEIARPRLERYGLLPPAPHRLDSEMQLYQLLGRETTNPHGRYKSLLRELVSFEHALDHRLARADSKCQTGKVK
jgi:hypothetical protein